MNVNTYHPSTSSVANPRFGSIVVIDPNTRAKIGSDKTWSAQDVFNFLSPPEAPEATIPVMQVTVDRRKAMEPVTDSYRKENGQALVVNSAEGANGKFTLLPQGRTTPATMEASLIGGLWRQRLHTTPQDIGLVRRLIGRQMVFTTYPKLIDELKELGQPNEPGSKPLSDIALLAFVSNPYVVHLMENGKGEDLLDVLRNLVAETDSKRKKRIRNSDLGMFLGAISTNPEGFERFLQSVKENSMLLGNFLEPLQTEISRRPTKHYKPIGLSPFYQALGDPKSDGWEQLATFLKQEWSKKPYDANSVDADRSFSPDAMEGLKNALHIVDGNYQAPNGQTSLNEHAERNKVFVEQYA